MMIDATIVRAHQHSAGAVKKTARKRSGAPGDKAYDADALIDTLKQRAITPVIPPRANRKAPRECDFVLYRERNLVERFFNKIKHFRAIATRYDKLARNFLAAVQLISAMVLLN
jgi:transposase